MECHNAASYSGAVYVFARVAGAWVQQAYVKASNTGASDQFGGVLALSADGSTLAVGVLNEDSSAMGINGDQASNGARDSGAVYVFSRTGTTWAQQAYIKASNTGVNDQFGGAIALSGDGSTLAVSARAESSGATGVDGDQTDNSASGAGAVYVYSRTGATWSQHTYIKASNAASMDLFGDSVALSDDGSTLAVGAYNEGSNAVGIDGDQANDLTSGAGAVYVFTRAGTTWLQSAYIKASNTDVNDMFGWALALSGDGTTLAVGVPYEDSNAVGVNGDQSANALQNPGAVYVFVNDAGTWSQQAYMKASNTGADAHFGATMAVASDGSTLAIGAPAERSLACGIGGDQTADSFWGDLGAVYLFRRTGTAWSQEAYMKASNTRGGTAFGVSLALSADASLLAVGGSGDSSNATGVGGNQTNNSAYYSGAIYGSPPGLMGSQHGLMCDAG